MNRNHPRIKDNTRRKTRRRALRGVLSCVLGINTAAVAAGICLRSVLLSVCALYGLITGAALWVLSKQMTMRERSLQEKLSEAKAEQTESARLLAGFSHELRTPLQSILGLSTLGQLRPGEAERCLREIGTAGAHLLELAGDGIEAGRLAEGGALTKAPFNLARLVDESRTMVAAQILRKGLVYRQETDYAGETQVCGDVQRLRQILVNLLGNAVKYTPEGGTVRLIVHRQADDGRTEFIVEDTGVGMDEKTLARVFEPYARAKDTAEEGAGLGLCVAQRLAKRMGGELEASSTPGKGSRFVLRVPLAADDGQAGREQTHRMHKGSRILIAEDNEQLRMILSELCGLCGAAVESVGSGLEAVRAVLSRQETHFCLVLLDEQMPEMTGSQAAECIREAGYVRLPIVALTGDTAGLANQELFSSVMEKPVELGRLWDCLDMWMK